MSKNYYKFSTVVQCNIQIPVEDRQEYLPPFHVLQIEQHVSQMSTAYYGKRNMI